MNIQSRSAYPHAEGKGEKNWLQTPHQLQFKAQDPKLITEDIIYTILNAVK